MHCMPLNMCHSSSAENASGLLARGGETYRRNRNGLETARFLRCRPGFWACSVCRAFEISHSFNNILILYKYKTNYLIS